MLGYENKRVKRRRGRKEKGRERGRALVQK